MTGAPLVVALSNARASRRPFHSARATFYDALKDADCATEVLEPFLGQRVQEADLKGLRALHRAVVPIVDALIESSPAPVDALNRLTARIAATHRLEVAPSTGGLRAVIVPDRPSAVGSLALVVVRELAELDPSRLRRCERPECRLVFYDTSRSATQRWHAESPCGLRERQRRHRANAPRH